MLDVVFEDNHLLVLNKRAGLATMGVSEDKPSHLEQAKEYVRRKYQKPGNIYLGVVSRLDAPVTGVTLFARTSKAARRLTEQFRNRDVEKTYWAIVEGRPDPPAGSLQNYLRKDERHRRMHIAESPSDAQWAELRYRPIQEIALQGSHGVSLSLVEIELLTGRKHQIRVQLSAAGWPIVGDRKYGSRLPFPQGIALHSRRLAIEHPVRRDRVEFLAPVPSSWRQYIRSTPQKQG